MGVASCHKQCPDSHPSIGLLAQLTGQSGPASPVGAARCARARRGHCASEHSEATWWRGRHDLTSGLGVAAAAASAPMEHSGATWWCGRCDLAGGVGVAAAVASAPMERGGAPGNVVGGEAHPSGGAAWRQWRMLRVAVFNGGEAAPVTDAVNGMALQCWGRREKVSGEPIWMEREHAVVLTDDGGRRRCSGGNQRGGGVSSCGSR
jgi:hypothetical protein